MKILRKYRIYQDLIKAMDAAERLELTYDVRKIEEREKGIMGSEYTSILWELTLHGGEVPDGSEGKDGESKS